VVPGEEAAAHHRELVAGYPGGRRDCGDSRSYCGTVPALRRWIGDGKCWCWWVVLGDQGALTGASAVRQLWMI